MQAKFCVGEEGRSEAEEGLEEVVYGWAVGVIDVVVQVDVFGPGEVLEDVVAGVIYIRLEVDCGAGSRQGHDGFVYCLCRFRDRADWKSRDLDS